VEELLGPHPVINNASIFATNPGVSYSLGWHRDVIQIPQDEIRDEFFSPEWPHNSVQINLPLYEEQSLWVVPGSHRRPNTPEENAAFGGSKHYAPLDAVMPGGRLHIVDFGQQEGWPRWFRTMLYAWLRQFSVYPRAELEAELRKLASDSGATLEFKRLYRGYAEYAVITKPA
jgi:hypothetical protein